MKKHYPSEKDWTTFRIRKVQKKTVTSYVETHQKKLNKFDVYSVPDFLIYVMKKYIGKNK